MALYDEHPLTDLDKKAKEILGDHAVIKSLASQAALQRLPKYVSEYMIAKFVKPETWKEDLANIQQKIKQLLPEQDGRELLKDKLLSQGEVTVMDNIEVKVDLKSGNRWARVPAINDQKVRVGQAITDANPGLMLGGMWGTAKLRYTPESNADAPNELVSFGPFQIGPPNLDEFKTMRGKFTTDEWCSLVLQSAGYAANAFPDRRTRMLLFARMAPLVERNLNIIELGPRQTGKTYLLRNLSPRVFVVSGGKTSPANLFVNLSTKQVGILGTRKVIVFDEIAHASFTDENETISTLKDYMESGNFSRGSMGFSSDAGLAFCGNIDVEDNQPAAKYVKHFLEPLPKELQDSAFHDRMHGYIPGWEIPKVSSASIATGVGFLTDYFGEALARMREESFAHRLNDVVLHANMTKRDTTAVERLTSALVKIMYPDGKMTPEELLEVVTFAGELRQRVNQQLVGLAKGEFKLKMIGPKSVEKPTAADLKLA